MVKRHGFTLAEVLFTMAIIGIVLVIVLPDMKYKIEVNKNLQLLQKTYSSLQQVTSRVIAENSEPQYWGMVDDDEKSITDTYNLYRPYFKVMRSCANSPGCWGYPTKNLKGDTYWQNHQRNWYQYTFTTMDGVNILMDIYPAATIQRDFGVKTDMDGVVFWVDVNAEHLPNTIGIDVFAFIVTRRGIVPAGYDDYSNCDEKKSGWGCAAKIIHDGWKVTYTKRK